MSLLAVFFTGLSFLKFAEAGIGDGVMDVNTLVGIVGGIGNMFRNDVHTEDVQLEDITGRWFQMYKAAINFDVFRTQMFCPVAYFQPNSVMGDGGFSMEEAYRVISKNGPIETYKRDVTKVGPGQYWMYTEEYFYPRQFYISKIGPNSTEVDYVNNTITSAEQGGEQSNNNYEYMIVTDANRLALMVFARDPLTFFQKYNQKVLDYLHDNGFGGSVFWNAPQPIYQGPDCQWPSEKETFARRVLKNQEKAAASEAAEKEQQHAQRTNQINPVSNAVQSLQSVIQNPRSFIDSFRTRR